MNKKIIIVVVCALLVCAGIGGGAWWWVKQQVAGSSVPEHAPVADLDTSKTSYVTLDKIVVMLRPDPQRVHNTYMSLDLVFRTDKSHEKAVKGDLPMLKGVAVRTLSKLDEEQARAMDIEAWTELLSKDLIAAYEVQQSVRAFDQVLVSRLIIE